ncbi:MAG: ABC transporter substrate-binding protein [Nitrospirae bacterium]|nr:ABC transporter substrate-binding protein [Nitrospirota bacterium]
MRKCFIAFTSLLFLFLIASRGYCSDPMQQLRVTVDKVIEILKRPDLKSPDKEELKRKLLGEVISERFDFQEMARRALARHWRKRTDQERKEFVRLFRKLLERTYLRRIEQYSDERIIYKEERIDPPYAIVKTVVITRDSVEIPIDYRLMQRSNDWKVYDVIIEGVSLVNNYRKQFDRIIRSSSYKSLVDRLRKKVE